MGNTQSNRNPSSMLQCFDPVTYEFSLDSYFKLRRKREIEKQEKDFFYETSIELFTQSPEKRKRRRRASWERNLKMYRCPMDNKLKMVHMVIPCTTDVNSIPIAVNSLSRNEFRDKLINLTSSLYPNCV